MCSVGANFIVAYLQERLAAGTFYNLIYLAAVFKGKKFLILYILRGINCNNAP